MTEQADENHRAWMLAALHRAAHLFGLDLVGSPVLGWNDRSISTAATSSTGGSLRWLRVVTEHLFWTNDDWWTGNQTATEITGIPKPCVIDVQEWTDAGQALRAEVMTYIPARPCSSTPELRHGLELPPRWWRDLRRALDGLPDVSTSRRAVDQERVSNRLRIFFGTQVDTQVDLWTTAHADLHWANLTGPDLAVLDWEMWGRAPYGYDAATLYCHSLLRPDVAQIVHDMFGEILDTPDGTRTQLYVITRMLLRAEGGDYPDLVIPLHHHARALLDASDQRAIGRQQGGHSR